MSESKSWTSETDYLLYEKFLASLDVLAGAALGEIYNEAYSYRGFHVGASFYAGTPDNGPLVFSAANLKRSGKEKVCAEKKRLDD